MSVLSTRRIRRTRDEGDDPSKKNGKKSGFWFKLLHPKNKRMEEIKGTKLVHTTSLIETLA